MTTDAAMGGTVVRRGFYALLSAASAMTYLLIVMGGIVCVTGSGQGCPDWPRCYGQIIPPANVGAIIETTHRFFAVLTSPLILAAAIVGVRRYRAITWLSRPPAIAMGLVLAVVVFGAFAVLTGLPPAIAAVDVGSALMVLALVLAAWAVAGARRHDPGLPDRLSFRDPFARLALGALVATFLVLVSGVLVADVGSIARCLGWPLYGLVAEAAEVSGALAPARRVLGGVAAVLIAALVIHAWRTRRGHAAILGAATGAGLLVLAEATVGLVMHALGFNMLLGGMYVAAAVGIWGLLVVTTILAALPSGQKQIIEA
jgi:cytochrome c oxidase assembly protein subunit 15